MRGIRQVTVLQIHLGEWDVFFCRFVLNRDFFLQIRLGKCDGFLCKSVLGNVTGFFLQIRLGKCDGFFFLQIRLGNRDGFFFVVENGVIGFYVPCYKKGSRLGWGGVP